MLKGHTWGYQCEDSIFQDVDILLTNKSTITYRQMGNALNGQGFTIEVGEDNLELHCPACDKDVFWYYYRFFERFLIFGTPHGKGWIDETDWFLELIEAMKPIKDLYFNDPENKVCKSGKS